MCVIVCQIDDTIKYKNPHKKFQSDAFFYIFWQKTVLR